MKATVEKMAGLQNSSPTQNSVQIHYQGFVTIFFIDGGKSEAEFGQKMSVKQHETTVHMHQ